MSMLLLLSFLTLASGLNSPLQFEPKSITPISPEIVADYFCEEDRCYPIFEHDSQFYVFPHLQVVENSIKYYFVPILNEHMVEFQVTLHDPCFLEHVAEFMNASVEAFPLKAKGLVWVEKPEKATAAIPQELLSQERLSSLYFHLTAKNETEGKAVEHFLKHYTKAFEMLGVSFEIPLRANGSITDELMNELMERNAIVEAKNGTFTARLHLAGEGEETCDETYSTTTSTVAPATPSTSQPMSTKAYICISTNDDPLCYDEHPCCASRAEAGECQTNPDYMCNNCRAACGYCTPDYSTDSCSDYFDNCPRWYNMGQCEANPDWMGQNCRVSCLLCNVPRNKGCDSSQTAGPLTKQPTTKHVTKVPPMTPPIPDEECYNEEPCCTWRAERGDCKSDETYMRENCGAACGFCTPMYTVDGSCKDYREHCGYWSRSGYCNSNKDWMAENCRYSCSSCSVPRESGCTGEPVTAGPKKTVATIAPPTTCGSRVEGACHSCSGGVRSYPRSMPNAHYYRRLCTTKKGIKVVTGPRASDYALNRAAFLLDKVLENVQPSVMQRMNSYGFKHAVMATYPQELTTHIPEHAFLGAYWNERARGLGGTTHIPTGSCAEENLMCHSNDRYRGEDITIHEFAHSLHLLGLKLVYPSFDSELTGLYNGIRYSSRNPWAGGYAMTDIKEYWAEAVQSYFDANSSRGPGTREQLRSQDPNMYNFVVKYLGNVNWRWRCNY